MSLARAWSVALLGVEGALVEVEADLASGLPGLALVGLPDTSLSEARDRVRAAVVNSGLAWPTNKRITVGLSPASLPKAGSGFDLAIAAAVLAAQGAVPTAAVEGRVLLGELGLDGRVRPARGVLPAVLAARREGRARVLVPVANAAEAAVVAGIAVEAVADLRQLVAVLRGEDPGSVPVRLPAPEAVPTLTDLADVVGQAEGKLAIEVAAAGGHHLLLTGPPGAGKTMLAERLPGLLPDLDDAESLEVSAVHSVAGLLPADAPLLRRPPLRAPHHSATLPALVGGGGRLLRPGAASLAHCGVLFLDEAPEFAPGVLDALRQPLEAGHVEIARAAGTARFPARFQLVLAANPCPCAAVPPAMCTCSSPMRRRYLGRLSGALLDRVDLRVEVLPVSRAGLLDGAAEEPGSAVAARALAARARARARWAGTPWTRNADIPGPVLRRTGLPRPVLAPLTRALELGRVSARGFDRALRVAWTLADLAAVEAPAPMHVEAALALRTGMAA